MIAGIDLSSWNTQLDWNKVKAFPELRFVYVRATQGLNLSDKMFINHRAGSIRSGLDFGATHFLDYFNYSRGQEVAFGKKQAEVFWTRIEDNPGQLPFALDTEKNDGADWGFFDNFQIGRILSIALAWHTRMKELSGRFGIDYVSAWVTAFMRNFLEGSAWIPRYKLVRATRDFYLAGKLVKAGDLYQPEIDHFLTEAELTAYLKPDVKTYPKYTIHQYSSRFKAEILGSDGYIDANYFNGSEAEYSVWSGKNCVPTSPVVDEDPGIPVALPSGELVTVLSGVNVRNDVGTSSDQYSKNGAYWVMQKGESAPVLERAVDTRGNPWYRIGYQEWVCGEYNGTKLLTVG